MLLNDNEYDFFFSIMKRLHQYKVLEEMMVIGGWSLYFYREYFKDAHVPLYRTADIDFLIPRPIRIQREIGVPEVMRELGFELKGNTKGYTKYVHPMMEVEFLVPELGRGREKAYEIPQLQINAVALRYLLLLQEYPLKVPCAGITVTVPEPAAFALHKYILSTIRPHTSTKGPKDLQTAQELSRFLLMRIDQQEKLRDVYRPLPKSWRNKLNVILREHHPELHVFLTGTHP